MIVYWDILFLINFFMDYLTIYATSKMSGVSSSGIKIGIASIAGGIYGIFIFENSIVAAGGLFFSLFMLYIAFSCLNMKIILFFYLNTFLFGGMGSFLNNLVGEVRQMGNMIYMENNLSLILIGGTIASFLAVFFFKLLKRTLIKEGQIKKILVSFEGKNIEIAGLMDTGNLLLDPVTGYPVILVFFEKIKDILPDVLKSFLCESRDLTSAMNLKYKNKIRLIPYKTAGDESILKGFKPDYIILKDNKERVIKDVIIAVVYKKISQNNEFEAVLNPQL